MESQSQRTIERPDRLRLDDVLVELTAGSADETFEADALNVGSGGLALRSPLLPEVGTRLICRFENPVDGEPIRAECEVVWASDHGPNLGEFGLRFERLSAESAESLRKLVEGDDRLMTMAEARELGWAAPPSSEPELIALEVDGVASELVAEVVHESGDVLVAEQDLPFLRIGKGVTTEHGRRGTLRAVDLRLDGDMPRLVLTVDYEAVPHAVDDGDPESDESIEESIRLETRVATPPSVAADRSDDAALLDDEDDTIPDDVPSPIAREPRPRIAEKVRAVSEPVVGRASEVAEAMRDKAADHLASAIPAMRAKLGEAREAAESAASDVTPKLVDGARELGQRASRFVRLLASKLREDAPEEPQKTRRVQRRPDERSVAPSPEVPRKLRGRHVLLGALGLMVAVLAIRGVLGAPDEPTPAPTPAPVAVESAPVVVAPAAPAVAPPPALPPTTELTPPMPAASPTMAGGPIPEPTYPTMPRAASPSAPEPEVATRPAAPPTRHFGAASVPGAMPFELMMTTPIDRIEGESTESGFTVRIAHSNSLTRASPIASQHPAVERASVTNMGENAVLSITWKPGRHPPYRVEANGNRLRILIGR